MAYAIVAYQTAYLKANHPVAFMAASMTLDLSNTDKLAGHMQECARLGIPILPPDINRSESAFTVLYDKDLKSGKILFGLGAIKGVGAAALHGESLARQIRIGITTYL